ncbi:hypothetical protein OPT61_g8408 [Boeremia exigua]|uniref:Uncharacterized protein n=1 Tax=Boeremia exigua TaxID=749465 RepID=A0ACC2HYQ4_9PLEO|nr:hypothetical protein OPT61_g8408 [Boeremia exigua]
MSLHNVHLSLPLPPLSLLQRHVVKETQKVIKPTSEHLLQLQPPANRTQPDSDVNKDHDKHDNPHTSPVEDLTSDEQLRASVHLLLRDTTRGQLSASESIRSELPVRTRYFVHFNASNTRLVSLAGDTEIEFPDLPKPHVYQYPPRISTMYTPSRASDKPQYILPATAYALAAEYNLQDCVTAVREFARTDTTFSVPMVASEYRGFMSETQKDGSDDRFVIFANDDQTAYHTICIHDGHGVQMTGLMPFINDFPETVPLVEDEKKKTSAVQTAAIYTASNKPGGKDVDSIHVIDRSGVEEVSKFGVCFVTSQLLRSDPSVSEVIPVRFNMPSSSTSEDDYNRAKRFMPVHYGLYVRFDDSITVLPVSLDLLGYRKRPFLSQRFASTVWNTDSVVHTDLGPYFISWDKDTGAGPLLELFQGFPLLFVNDSKLILPATYATVGQEINADYGKVQETWAEDMTVHPHKTWQPLGVSTGELAKRLSSTHSRKEIPLVQYLCSCKRSRATIQVDITGRVYPFCTIDMGDITIRRPPTPKQTVSIPSTAVNNRLSCNFTYDCLDVDLDEELGICRTHLQRTIDLVVSGTASSNLLTGALKIQHREWSVPTTPVNAKKFIKTLTYIHTHDDKDMFSIDFEGLANTRQDIAAIPMQVGVVNIGTRAKYMGFFAYDHAVDEMASKNAIYFKAA